MMNILETLHTFHRAMGLPSNDSLTQLSVTERKLRLELQFSEFLEQVRASGFTMRSKDMESNQDGNYTFHHIEGSQQDSVEMADALGDQVIVAFGSAASMGVDLNAVIQEQMRANFSKFDDDGNPIVNDCVDVECAFHGTTECCVQNHMRDPFNPIGKRLKGPNYIPPNLREILGV